MMKTKLVNKFFILIYDEAKIDLSLVEVQLLLEASFLN